MDAWSDKLDDADFPLFTIAVVAEVLEVDVQVIRRFDDHGIADPVRSDGNQRRYSRTDVERLAYALQLVEEGMTRAAIARIFELEAELDDLKRRVARSRRGRAP